MLKPDALSESAKEKKREELLMYVKMEKESQTSWWR